MTLLFVSLNKSLSSYTALFNYFVLQERLGLLFLLFVGGYIQLLLLLLKVGVAPFHFWIFRVLNSVYGFNLVWFLTFQKLPFIFVIVQFITGLVLFVFLLGLILCLIQMFLVKNFKNLLILSSTESFNWVILGLVISFFRVLFLFVYYFLLMIFLIPKFDVLLVKGFVG